MTTAAGHLELLKWLGQAAVVVVGWIVVHRMSVQRDRDNTRAELLTAESGAMMEAIDGLITESRSYHLGVRNTTTELQLKMALQDLAYRAVGLSDICSTNDLLASCRSDIGQIRRAMTGAHFEDEHLGPLPDTDPQLQRIADAALKAKQTLRKLRHRQFKL